MRQIRNGHPRHRIRIKAIQQTKGMEAHEQTNFFDRHSRPPFGAAALRDSFRRRKNDLPGGMPRPGRGEPPRPRRGPGRPGRTAGEAGPGAGEQRPEGEPLRVRFQEFRQRRHLLHILLREQTALRLRQKRPGTEKPGPVGGFRVGIAAGDRALRSNRCQGRLLRPPSGKPQAGPGGVGGEDLPASPRQGPGVL